MYRGLSVSPLASSALISASAVWSMAGISTFWAYALYAGQLDIMFEITSPLSASPWRRAYSIARMPPQDTPSRKKFVASRPSAVRTCSTSSTNRSSSHRPGSSGWSLYAEPSWS